MTRQRLGAGRAAVAEDGGVRRPLPEPATGRDCSSSTTSVNHRGPPSMSRRVGYQRTEQMSRKKLEDDFGSGRDVHGGDAQNGADTLDFNDDFVRGHARSYEFALATARKGKKLSWGRLALSPNAQADDRSLPLARRRVD